MTRRLHLFLFFFLLSVFCLPASGYANCASPFGTEGKLMYNADTYHVLQFCDGTNWVAMGPVPGSGPGPGYNKVFIAYGMSGYDGSMNGGDADPICQGAATGAGLAGTYKVWLATTTGVDDPATRFTHSTIPYKEVDGTLIANNWADLTDGTLQNGITLDASGGGSPASTVWTNVATNGTAITSGSSSSDNCNGWSTYMSAYSGWTGSPGATDATWTNSGTYGICDGGAGLYCFQQDGDASCVNPSGTEGQIKYNGDKHVMQYCDGSHWRAMGPVGGSANKVFTTTATSTGSLGGVAGANATCASAATAAGLPGTYKAWVAVTTGVDDPATTFTHPTMPYKLVDGTLIANNWTDLTDGTLQHAINEDEHGNPANGGVWTNVDLNGTAKVSGSSTSNCTAWTNNTNLQAAYTGAASVSSNGWTVGISLYACNYNFSLYCFQQDSVAVGCTPSVGTVMPDGSVYAGRSPDGNVPMNATRCDAGQYWNGSACTACGSGLWSGSGSTCNTTWSSTNYLTWNNGTSNWTVTGFTSTTTGLANTAALAALADAGSPYNAASYCKNLSADGHADWYLPGEDELNVMYINKAAIANFDTTDGGTPVGGAYPGMYWTSTEYNSIAGQTQVFSTGGQTNGGKNALFSVRCVRKSPPATEGSFFYNTDYCAYEYCDGVNWQAMGRPFAQPHARECTTNTCGAGPVKDCAGTCGGSAVKDCAGVCNGTAGPAQIVFQTLASYAANIGSVAAANTDCATAATAVGLAGTYKAWLAVTTGTDDPATTFTHPTTPYKLVDGTLIANNWTGLISGTLLHAISETESGGAANNDSWTNVATNGTATVSGSSNAGNCTAWTSTNGVRTGKYGAPNATNATWTDIGTNPACNSFNSLFCFQQDTSTCK